MKHLVSNQSAVLALLLTLASRYCRCKGWTRSSTRGACARSGHIATICLQVWVTLLSS